MENNNSAMDTVDWRTELPPDAREETVTIFTDILKKHIPHSGEERLNELKKIAKRFEEKIYSAASSESDYHRKISLKKLTMETRVPDSMPNNQVCGSNRPLGLGSLGINNQVQPLTMPLQPNQPQTFQQLMPQTMQNQTRVQNSPLFSPSARFSQIQNSMPNLIPQNSNVGSNLQNPIGNVMIGQGSLANNKYENSYLQLQLLRQQQQKFLQQRGALQLPQAAPPSVLAADQNPLSLLPGTSLVPFATSPISVGQIGSVNGAEWQDEVYRKIKLMKDLYLPELLELQVKITTSLQGHGSLPKNRESEPLEKLNLLKFMLEKAISFLEVSKLNISEKYKNNRELVLRERQIMNFVNMNRPGNLFSEIQQPPMSGRNGWAAEHQAMQQVQIPPVPQSFSSSLFSRVQEAATKIRSEKKSSSLSEPLFSDSNSMMGFGVDPYWLVLGLALMVLGFGVFVLIINNF